LHTLGVESERATSLKLQLLAVKALHDGAVKERGELSASVPGSCAVVAEADAVVARAQTRVEETEDALRATEASIEQVLEKLDYTVVDDFDTMKRLCGNWCAIDRGDTFASHTWCGRPVRCQCGGFMCNGCFEVQARSVFQEVLHPEEGGPAPLLLSVACCNKDNCYQKRSTETFEQTKLRVASCCSLDTFAMMNEALRLQSQPTTRALRHEFEACDFAGKVKFLAGGGTLFCTAVGCSETFEATPEACFAASCPKKHRVGGYRCLLCGSAHDTDADAHAHVETCWANTLVAVSPDKKTPYASRHSYKEFSQGESEYLLFVRRVLASCQLADFLVDSGLKPAEFADAVACVDDADLKRYTVVSAISPYGVFLFDEGEEHMNWLIRYRLHRAFNYAEKPSVAARPVAALPADAEEGNELSCKYFAQLMLANQAVERFCEEKTRLLMFQKVATADLAEELGELTRDVAALRATAEQRSAALAVTRLAYEKSLEAALQAATVAGVDADVRALSRERSGGHVDDAPTRDAQFDDALECDEEEDWKPEKRERRRRVVANRIVGNKLHTNGLVASRELVQNAVDLAGKDHRGRLNITKVLRELSALLGKKCSFNLSRNSMDAARNAVTLFLSK
jgi:hypothetical protein